MDSWFDEPRLFSARVYRTIPDQRLADAVWFRSRNRSCFVSRLVDSIRIKSGENAEQLLERMRNKRTKEKEKEYRMELGRCKLVTGANEGEALIPNG